MGAPAFQYRDFFFYNGVAALSSNFALYSDMSERVVMTLDHFGFPIDVYSIDEAFIDLPHAAGELFAKEVRSTVLQWTGIPVSIGLGKTKTLAKAAGELAKKEAAGVKLIAENDLVKFPVEDIWGIGPKTAARLKLHRIEFAGQLIECSDAWIQQNFSVAMLRTVLELRGTSCLSFEQEAEPKKGIATTRTFGRYLTEFHDLKEAVSSFVATAAEKLRSQSSSASSMTVFIEPKNRPSFSAYISFPIPTSSTPELLGYAQQGLKEIYRSGEVYRRAGVMLHDLVPASAAQLDLFAPSKNSVMSIVDRINRKKGKNTIFFGSQGIDPKWKSLSGQCSPKYTTQWPDLMKVKINGR